MTSTDLVVPPLLLDVRTGEALEATPENAAVLLHALNQHIGQAMEAKRMCVQVLVAASRQQGSKTLHLPGGKVEVHTGSELQWDLELLAELRKEGLPEDRWNELVRETVERKVDARVAKQLEAANERYAAIIQAARKRIDKPASVSLK